MFWGSFTSSWKEDVNWMCLSLINIAFKFYANGYCCIKVENNIFRKSQDYNAKFSHQAKRKRAEILLKEVLDKNKSPLLQVRAPQFVLALLRTIITHPANICSWNIRGTFPWYIPGIFGKCLLRNSGEYSQIMFREYWIQEYSLNVPWIS